MVGGLPGACVSRSAWDSLARSWEEHVVLILSMSGLRPTLTFSERQRKRKEKRRKISVGANAGGESALTPLPHILARVL